MNAKKQAKRIEAKILKKITPTKKELDAEKKMVEEIRKKISRIKGKHSHLEWCGSSARGTHLKGDRDIDLFVMFNKELSEKELEEEGLRIGKNVFRGYSWEKAYSQHPYIRGSINGFDIEIVPSYIVTSGAEKKSAVDRTPFHNKYLLKKMNKKQKSETRLLKQFLKGIKAYGADLKNQALPGYGVELLIMYYGSFEKALKGISKWKEKEVIVLEKTKSTEDFIAPLVIIDPVDANRNVASALSTEQYEKMKLAAKKYLKEPSEGFFYGKNNGSWPKEKVMAELAKKEFIAIQGPFPKKYLSDIMWGQLRRFLRKVANALEEKDFVVIKSALWSDEEKVFFMYELNALNLDNVRKVYGPLAGDKENVKKFLEKGRKIISGPTIENGRITLVIEREHISAKKVVEDFVKECKKSEKDGMKICLRKAEVLSEKEILKHYSGAFAEHFTKYLEGKEVFE